MIIYLEFQLSLHFKDEIIAEAKQGIMVIFMFFWLALGFSGFFLQKSVLKDKLI